MRRRAIVIVVLLVVLGASSTAVFAHDGRVTAVARAPFAIVEALE